MTQTTTERLPLTSTSNGVQAAQERIDAGSPLNVCEPVQLEFGRPPDTDLLTDPDNEPFIFEISANLVDSHTYDRREVDNGVAPRRAIQLLGCGACDLAKVNVCTIKTDLESRAEEAESNRGVLEKATMLITAPDWLNAARVNLSGSSPDELIAMEDQGIDTLKELDAEGTVDKWLAGSKNELEGIYKKADLPELANVACIDKDAELVAHKIETDNGDVFTVIDATLPVGFTGTAPDALSYGVLTGKLLNRMRERDPQGNPQIMTADSNNKMQKSITRMESGANTFEIRMNGKKRLYVVVQPNAGKGEAARITIMGSHGGDERTQKDFIAHIA